jgi:rod shape-determining protein MreC
LSLSNGVTGYFGLKEDNLGLAEENKELLQRINDLNAMKVENQKLVSINEQLNGQVLVDTVADSTSVNHIYTYPLKTRAGATYRYSVAKVLKNDIRYDENYITLDKGSKDGVKKDMGVMTAGGIVGRVVSVSGNYSLVKSLLHVENQIAVQLKKNNEQGSLRWTGQEVTKAELRYIPKHIKMTVGDTIETSGFNLIYPQGCLVGKVVEKKFDKHNNFYTAQVELFTDFSSLDYVYLVEWLDKEELKTLQR